MAFAYAGRAVEQPIALLGDKLARRHLQHQTVIEGRYGGEVELCEGFDLLEPRVTEAPGLRRLLPPGQFIIEQQGEELDRPQVAEPRLFRAFLKRVEHAGEP